MNALAIVLRLLPLVIRAVEMALGARNGVVKRQAVLDLVLGVMGLVAPNLETPELRETIGKVVDMIVGALNEAGVFKRSAK